MEWQKILKLKGKQKDIDVNNNDKIDAKDFEALREKGEKNE
tara:strand:+ start:399 stop:521 length:123 start_codon:yes stop_codon:yes gene_type:complete